MKTSGLLDFLNTCLRGGQTFSTEDFDTALVELKNRSELLSMPYKHVDKIAVLSTGSSTNN